MFTKGEWDIATIDGGAGDDEIVTIIDGCMVNICQVFGQAEYEVVIPGRIEGACYTVSIKEAKANARLIAAAPRLFEALQHIVEEVNLPSDNLLILAAKRALFEAQEG